MGRDPEHKDVALELFTDFGTSATPCVAVAPVELAGASLPVASANPSREPQDGAHGQADDQCGDHRN